MPAAGTLLAVAAIRNASASAAFPAGVPVAESLAVETTVAGPPCTTASDGRALVAVDKGIAVLAVACRGSHSAGSAGCTWQVVAYKDNR